MVCTSFQISKLLIIVVAGQVHHFTFYSGQSHESNGSGSTWAIFTVAFLPLLLSEGAMAAETELLCVAGNQFHGRHRLQLSAILTASVCH